MTTKRMKLFDKRHELTADLMTQSLELHAQANRVHVLSNRIAAYGSAERALSNMHEQHPEADRYDGETPIERALDIVEKLLVLIRHGAARSRKTVRRMAKVERLARRLANR